MSEPGAGDQPPGRSGLEPGRLEDVLAAIDAANSGDPNILTVGDLRGPKELLHSEMVTAWVRRLDPGADDAQLVAARAHHLRRWTRPRAEYPEGRAGYRRWRNAAAKAQAEEVGTILAEHGAPQGFADRVTTIIRKQGLGSDPAVQTHEDALCLVFLETQLDDLLESLGEQHCTEVLARTIPKMSGEALERVPTLDLGSAGARAVAAAIDAVKRNV